MRTAAGVLLAALIVAGSARRPRAGGDGRARLRRPRRSRGPCVGAAAVREGGVRRSLLTAALARLRRRDDRLRAAARRAAGAERRGSPARGRGARPARRAARPGQGRRLRPVDRRVDLRLRASPPRRGSGLDRDRRPHARLPARAGDAAARAGRGRVLPVADAATPTTRSSRPRPSSSWRGPACAATRRTCATGACAWSGRSPRTPSGARGEPPDPARRRGLGVLSDTGVWPLGYHALSTMMLARAAWRERDNAPGSPARQPAPGPRHARRLRRARRRRRLHRIPPPAGLDPGRHRVRRRGRRAAARLRPRAQRPLRRAGRSRLRAPAPLPQALAERRAGAGAEAGPPRVLHGRRRRRRRGDQRPRAGRARPGRGRRRPAASRAAPDRCPPTARAGTPSRGRQPSRPRAAVRSGSPCAAGSGRCPTAAFRTCASTPACVALKRLGADGRWRELIAGAPAPGARAALARPAPRDRRRDRGAGRREDPRPAGRRGPQRRLSHRPTGAGCARECGSGTRRRSVACACASRRARATASS